MEKCEKCEQLKRLIEEYRKETDEAKKEVFQDDTERRGVVESEVS